MFTYNIVMKHKRRKKIFCLGGQVKNKKVHATSRARRHSSHNKRGALGPSWGSGSEGMRALPAAMAAMSGGGGEAKKFTLER